MPPYDNRMICFTSPNHFWLNSMRKDNFHAAIFMPTWTFEELVEANEILGLKIPKFESENSLEKKFEIFGGIARFCLNPIWTNCKLEIERLKTEISQEITSLDVLKNMLFSGFNCGQLCHSVFHIAPKRFQNLRFPIFSEFFIGSDFIKEKIIEVIEKANATERNKFVQIIKENSAATNLYGQCMKDDVIKYFLTEENLI